MKPRNSDNPAQKYKAYIEEASLSEDYKNRDIRFDSDEDLKAVSYKNNRYQSVGDYRDKKQYPSKEIDKRSPEFDFDKMSAHGTSLASVISCLLYTNKQLVPGIKLRKLIGASSTSGESKGQVRLDSEHLNNKFISAVTLSERIHENQVNGLYIALGYSTSFLSEKKGQASNVPVLIFGDGVGEGKVVQSRAENEHGWKRMNIRLLALRENDVADVMAVLRALEIYDVKVCTLENVNKLYLDAGEASSLKALWEEAVFVDPDIPLSIYEENAEKSHLMFKSKEVPIRSSSFVPENEIQQEASQSLYGGLSKLWTETVSFFSGADEQQVKVAEKKVNTEPTKKHTDDIVIEEKVKKGKEELSIFSPNKDVKRLANQETGEAATEDQVLEKMEKKGKEASAKKPSKK